MFCPIKKPLENFHIPSHSSAFCPLMKSYMPQATSAFTTYSKTTSSGVGGGYVVDLKGTSGGANVTGTSVTSPNAAFKERDCWSGGKWMFDCCCYGEGGKLCGTNEARLSWLILVEQFKRYIHRHVVSVPFANWRVKCVRHMIVIW